MQSGSSSGDERVIGRGGGGGGHQSRADSVPRPRHRRVLPDVDVATAVTLPTKPGKFTANTRVVSCVIGPLQCQCQCGV